MRPLVNMALGPYLRRQRRETQALLERTTHQPAVFQEQTLQRIVEANAATTYGRDHGFSKIHSIADFRSAVPVNTYEELRPYVDRIADGSDPHALTADPVEMFTNTSGTTSKPKLI